MRKLLIFCLFLLTAVLCSACVNTYAVYELNERAVQAMKDGDTEGAIARWLSSVDLDGENYETRYNLANAYIETGECEKAVEHAKVAVNLSKNQALAHYTLAAAGECAAENLLKTKNKDGEVERVDLENNPYARKIVSEYIEYLEISNSNFDKYVTLQPNAEDTKTLIDRIAENKEIIKEYKERFDIQQ